MLSLRSRGPALRSNVTACSMSPQPLQSLHALLHGSCRSSLISAVRLLTATSEREANGACMAPAPGRLRTAAPHGEERQRHRTGDPASDPRVPVGLPAEPGLPISSLAWRNLQCEGYTPGAQQRRLRLRFGASRSGCNVDDDMRQMTKSHALV